MLVKWGNFSYRNDLPIKIQPRFRASTHQVQWYYFQLILFILNEVQVSMSTNLGWPFFQICPQASTSAKHIYGDLILRFGLPGRITHNQGREFENKILVELERLSCVEKSRNTPYHPQCNGAIDRLNANLLKLPLPENHKSKYHKSFNKMLFDYNATRHDSTGYSPYYLLFGREAINP